MVRDLSAEDATLRHTTFSAGLDPQDRSILALDATDESRARCDLEVFDPAQGRHQGFMNRLLGAD